MASPVDMLAASAPAQKSPTMTGAMSVLRIICGSMKSGDWGALSNRTPAKAMK
jgi:hypothetical protein